MPNEFEYALQGNAAVSSTIYHDVPCYEATAILKPNGFRYFYKDNTKRLDLKTITVHLTSDNTQDELGFWCNNTVVVNTEHDLKLSIDATNRMYLLEIESNKFVAINKLTSKLQASAIYSYQGSALYAFNNQFIIENIDELVRALTFNSLPIWLEEVKNFTSINIYPFYLVPVIPSTKYITVKITKTDGVTKRPILTPNELLFMHNIDTVELYAVNLTQEDLMNFHKKIIMYRSVVLNPVFGILSNSNYWQQDFSHKQTSFGLVSNINKLTLKMSYHLLTNTDEIYKTIKGVFYEYNSNGSNPRSYKLD